MTKAQVMLFTSPTCPHCPSARRFGEEYFAGRDDVEYTQLSAQEPEAREKAQMYGIRSVPTFVVIGDGYDKPIGVSGTPSGEHMTKLIKLAKGEIREDELH